MTGDGADALRRLGDHPVLTRRLPGRGPLTYREHAELGEDEARAREGAVQAIKALPEWREAVQQVRALGRAAYTPAVSLLSRLWRDCPVVPVRDAAGHALFEIGTTDAHADLQAAIERSDHLSTFLAIKSVVVTASARAYDILGPYLSEESISTPGMVRVASAILEFFQPRSPVGVGDERWLAFGPRVLRDDERWVHRAIELRRYRGVEQSARRLLASLTSDELNAALARWPDPPCTPPAPYAGRRDFVARYLAGEHEAVWRELRSAGAVEDAVLRAEATAVAVMTMQRVRRNVEVVTERLRRAGYPFDGALPAWMPPEADVDKAIARIESAAGGPCPISLRAFWSVVGEVYWKHAEDVETDGAPWGTIRIAEADPLCVAGPNAAWDSVEEWLERRDEDHPEVVGPLEVDLAPDYLHKANISGGAPYAIRLPSKLVDPPFEHEEHGLPFIDYLRLCFRRGGFSRIHRLTLDDTGREFVESLRRDLETF